MGTVAINGNTYTVYGTLAEADVYLGGSFRFASAWATLTPDRKKQALVEVARTFDAKQWLGVVVSSSQALAWPRTGTFGTNVTPDAVVDASFLMAGLLAKNPGLLGGGNAQAPLQTLKEGPTSATFFFQARTAGPGSVDEVDALLALYLGSDDAPSMAGQVSGTDGVTAFSDDYALEIS